MSNFEHGTTRAYSRGCHCPACCKAHADHRRDYRHLKRDGYKFWSTLRKSQAHINELLAGGMTKREIARAAGVHPRAISNIIRGRVSKVRSETEDGILSVHRDDGTSVGAWRFRLLIANLERAGYSIPEVAVKLNISDSTVRRSLSGDRCTMATFERARILYRLAVKEGIVSAGPLDEVQF